METARTTLLATARTTLHSTSHLYRHLTYTIHSTLQHLEQTPPLATLFTPLQAQLHGAFASRLAHTHSSHAAADTLVWALSCVLLYATFSLLAAVCRTGGRAPVYYIYEASVPTRALLAWALAGPLKWAALAYHSGLVLFAPESAGVGRVVWWVTSRKYQVYHSLARILAWEVVVLVTVLVAKGVVYYVRGGATGVGREGSVGDFGPGEEWLEGSEVRPAQGTYGAEEAEVARQLEREMSEVEVEAEEEEIAPKKRGRKARSTSARRRGGEVEE